MVAFSCNKLTCSALKLELFACALLDHFWLVSLVLHALVVSPSEQSPLCLNLCKIVFLPVYFLLVFFISVTIAVFDLVGSPI